MMNLYNKIKKEHVFIFLVIFTALVIFNYFDEFNYTGLVVKESCYDKGYSCCFSDEGEGMNYFSLDDTCKGDKGCWEYCERSEAKNLITGDVGFIDSIIDWFKNLFKKKAVGELVSGSCSLGKNKLFTVSSNFGGGHASVYLTGEESYDYSVCSEKVKSTASYTSTSSATKVGKIFVTSATYSGDLIDEAADDNLGFFLTGIEGADALCQMHADEAGLSGEWIALLSDSSTDLIDRIPDDISVIKNMHGDIVANSKGDLFGDSLGSVNLLDFFNYDEESNSLGSNSYVWTGSYFNGKKNIAGMPFSAYDCNNWTEEGSSSPNGMYGYSILTTEGWVSNGAGPCDNGGFYHLYCFNSYDEYGSSSTAFSSGMGTSLIALSDLISAHVEKPSLENYGNVINVEDADGSEEVTVGYPTEELGCDDTNTCCTGYDECLFSISSDTSAHVADCGVFDTDVCVSVGEGVCNNDGVKDYGEECDGSDLGGQTCQGLEFNSGTLACKSDCTFDTLGCISGSCTDGEIELCFLQGGVCVNSFQTCIGNAWPGCESVYPTLIGYEDPEISCSDGKDNDCDGLVDSLDDDCDITPPTTESDPPEGEYDGMQRIVLRFTGDSVQDGHQIYYTKGVGGPTQLDPQQQLYDLYTAGESGIPIEEDTTFKFFGVDYAGNVETPIKEALYIINIEGSSPVASILAPAGGEGSIPLNPLAYPTTSEIFFQARIEDDGPMDYNWSSDQDGLIHEGSCDTLNNGNYLCEPEYTFLVSEHLSVGDHVITFTVEDEDNQIDSFDFYVRVYDPVYPGASIEYPTEVNNEIPLGANIEFRGMGTKSGDEFANDLASYEWILDGESIDSGDCEGGEEYCSSIISTNDLGISLNMGLHTIVFAITDDGGLSTEDTLKIEIIPSDSPEAIILEPTHVGNPSLDEINYIDFVEGASIPLRGSAISAEGRSITGYKWHFTNQIKNSELEGQDQDLIAGTDLDIGYHTVTLTVVDDLLNEGTDYVLIHVKPQGAPTAYIKSPNSSSKNPEFYDYEIIPFVGEADGEIADWIWTSNKNGDLSNLSGYTLLGDGDGSMFNLPASSLYYGWHVITLIVVADNDQKFSDSFSIYIGINPSSAPTAIIDFPEEGNEFNFGEAIDFKARAWDSDGEISRYSFCSNLISDGCFKEIDNVNQQSLSINFPFSLLSIGPHEIIFTAYDDSALFREDTVNIKVVGGGGGSVSYDYNGDNLINIFDLMILLDHYGESVGGANSKYDVDGDGGNVDSDDLELLIIDHFT